MYSLKRQNQVESESLQKWTSDLNLVTHTNLSFLTSETKFVFWQAGRSNLLYTSTVCFYLLSILHFKVKCKHAENTEMYLSVPVWL